MSVALEQIAQWHDEQGHNGLWYVMQVVSQLLDPRTSEFTAAFVGRLVSTLISKAGSELGENLDQILRAILSKMQQAETLSVMQVSRFGTQESEEKQQEKKLSPLSFIACLFMAHAVGGTVYPVEVVRKMPTLIRE